MRAAGPAGRFFVSRAASVLGLASLGVASLGLSTGLLGCGAPAKLEAAPTTLSASSASGSAAPAASVATRAGDLLAASPLLAAVRPETDYLVIGPRELVGAVEPLLAHREAQGHVVARLAVEDLVARRFAGATDAQALAAGINAVASKAGARLRFVLLVGDAPGPGEAPHGFTPLPAFYLPKLGYGGSSPRARRPRYGSLEAPGDPFAEGRRFASDLPYAYANRGAKGQPDLDENKAPPPLAVGRVPARTADEALGFAKKAVGYDTATAEGTWRRRLQIIGGPANFGAIADSLIESIATSALDQGVPYDYDVRVAFLKPDSPYMIPYPDIRRRIADDLNAGALIAAYMGHGASTSFAHIRHGYRYYAVSTTEDAEALRIPEGKPFFISITCNTGELDLPGDHRSLAEGMILNPEGPIAVFASSRESHPYPNALYGQAIAEIFLKRRAATVGEGIVEAKRAMLEGSIPLAPVLFDDDPDALKAEHEGLYNLFGDPATKLRYPKEAELTIGAPSGDVLPGASFTVSLEAPGVPSGTADLTVETRRSVIRGALTPPDKLKTMREPEAWAAMNKNYAMAMDKVVTRSKQRLEAGRATFRIKAPKDPGEYELKVLASGGGEAAAGHTRLNVKARGAR